MNDKNRKCKVLIVDDDEINLKVAVGMMTRLGVEADYCSNGNNAVAKAADENYDIIFIDHLMPGMDGVETLNAIKSVGGTNASSIMIAMTANMSDSSGGEYIDKGFDDYISKPVDIIKLGEIVERCMSAKYEDGEENTDIELLNGEPVVIFLRDKGYNTDAGLSFSNWNITVYQNLLESFGRKAVDSLERLRQQLDEKNYSYYSTLASTYKNDAKNVGSTALYNRLFKHQLAAGARDVSYLTGDFGSLEKLWTEHAEIAISAAEM